jgi:transcriptional regulator with XRE-family HTH domain
MEQAKELGRRLQRAREARGMTRKQVAKLLDRAAHTIYRYERGLIEPSYEDLPLFATLYGVTVAALVDPEHATTVIPEHRSNYNRGPAAIPGKAAPITAQQARDRRIAERRRARGPGDDDEEDGDAAA